MLLTLDQRILKDLDDLLKKSEIDSSKDLNAVPVLKADTFSTKGLPGYFCGKRDAKTVLVMLNPGCDAIVADHNYSCDICKLKIDDKHGLTTFVNSYIDASTNYGRIDHWRYDAFDVKQAQFLYPWKDSGITFPTYFPSDPNTFLDAKEAVLMQKLQLELVPYCSRTFAINKIEPLLPYVETLFEEISSDERNYVIFCSAIFERIFKAYEKKYKGSILGLLENPTSGMLKRVDGTYTKNKYYCRKITIIYKGKSFPATIAHSFPMQGLNSDLMSQYGKFCYDNYI